MKYKFIMHLLNYFFNKNTTMTNYELKHYILTCPNFYDYESHLICYKRNTYKQ